MAGTRRKKTGKLKFELSKEAVGGIGVVIFCLFLWVFIIGVWAGQYLLYPERGERNHVVVKNEKRGHELQAEKVQLIRADKRPRKVKNN